MWHEDTVEYRLFPVLPFEEGEELQLLTECAVKYTHFSTSILPSHIWHFEPFRLCPWHEQQGSLPPHVFGQTCFRDNVEDEWLIVYILFKLSERFEDLVISVSDSDGEFLLIEAANMLPKWVNPESAENRVFIYRAEAVKTVRTQTLLTRANAQIQETIHKRLSCFPHGLQTSVHRAHCHLPYTAAYVLSRDPQLVAAAVHAFCDHDNSNVQVCRKMEHFSATKHSCITARVDFTRCLYAKLLRQQNLGVPRNSGFKTLPSSHPQHKAYDLGMKLACGLEMLLCSAGGMKGGSGEEEVTKDSRWPAFVQGLKEKGYFQGELEGSKLYSQLLQTAKEYFDDNIVKDRSCSRELPFSEAAAGRNVARLLFEMPPIEGEGDTVDQCLPPADDDSWLELSPEQLDRMMCEASGGDRKPSELDLQSMVFGMKTFVDKVSSHKGAEFPWSVDEPAQIAFDPESFADAVHSLLDGDGSEEDISDGSENSSGEDEEMSVLMEEMDRELAGTEVGKTFEREKVSTNGGEDNQSSPQPVDIDFNLVKNLLDSYGAQEGMAGPASNILQSLGVDIPLATPDK
ncbi:hypothetical protein EMCRGX_G028539 [Ephydatia muelleri]